MLRDVCDYTEPARLRHRGQVQRTGVPLVLPDFGIDRLP